MTAFPRLSKEAEAYMGETLTRAFAAECGYRGSSPAMLKAFEDIRQAGIREARKGHYDRKAVIDEFKRHPGAFFAAIRPSLTTDEAIEDANRIIFGFRRLPTWQQANRRKYVFEAKQLRLQARYFRRFGFRIWQERAA